jgi:hypothetical protein
MRQVFSSARLENVEAVAAMLREAGVEVQITGGRSYKGNRRTTLSYADDEAQRPAVWVVKSEDNIRARELLRESGLVDSTRPGDGPRLSYRSEFDDTPTRTPAERRMFRIKIGLLLVIATVIGMALYRGAQTPPVPNLASGPFDGRRAATLVPVAQAVLASELASVNTPVACLAVDGADAPAGVRDALRPRDGLTVVPASHCERIADEDSGSVHPNSKQLATIVDVTNFRPTAADAGTIEFHAYHHRMSGRYKTLEVRRVDGRWRVTRTLRHVAS